MRGRQRVGEDDPTRGIANYVTGEHIAPRERSRQTGSAIGILVLRRGPCSRGSEKPSTVRVIHERSVLRE